MKGVLGHFEYLEPTSVEEAIQMMSTYGTGAKVLAGGTDLLVSMKRKETSPKCLICIKSLSELNYIRFSQETGLRIGALVTHADIAKSEVIKKKFGLLAVSCNKVGTPQIRNMGTIGGNICQAGPSQDSIPPLLALDARLKLKGPEGERIIPISNFLIGPFQTVLNETELLTEILVPPPLSNSGGCYKWITKRSVADETLVGVAVYIVTDSNKRVCRDIRIGLGSVAPAPFRAMQAEGMLRGKQFENHLLEQVAVTATEETKPRSRGDYRRNMTKVLVRRAIGEILQKIE